MDTTFSIVSGVMLVAGAFLAFSAAVGVLRFPDTLSRMHAATKPQTLGLLLVMCGAAISLRDSVDVWMLVLVVLFQFLTAPVSAHLVGRLAYRTNNVRKDTLIADDLASFDPPHQPHD